jgi:ketosteroid isomerase-like protein
MNQQARQIVELEKTFWQSMADKDTDRAMSMIADECLITGPQGTLRSDPEDYKRLTEQAEWDLEDFELSDVQVIFPVEDTAIIAYKVHQTGTMKDQPMDLNCADSTTWVREGAEWKCALHTETILENA